MSVSIYYGKLNSLWEELYKHEPLISCNCYSSCDAGSRHASRYDTQKLHYFEWDYTWIIPLYVHQFYLAILYLRLIVHIILFYKMNEFVRQVLRTSLCP